MLCEHSLEAPQRGISDEYPQHMFSWRNKKTINTSGLKKNILSRAMYVQEISENIWVIGLLYLADLLGLTFNP